MWNTDLFPFVFQETFWWTLKNVTNMYNLISYCLIWIPLLTLSSHRQVLPGLYICFKKPLYQFSTAALWPRKVKCWKYCPPQLDHSSSAICTPQVQQEGTRACCPSAPAASDWWAPQTERVETAGSCFRGSAFAVSYTETTQGGVLQSMGKMKA